MQTIAQTKPKHATRHVMVQGVWERLSSTYNTRAKFDTILDEAMKFGLVVSAGHLGGYELIKLSDQWECHSVDEKLPTTDFPGSKPSTPSSLPPTTTTPLPSTSSSVLTPAPLGTKKQITLTGPKAKFVPLIKYVSMGDKISGVNLASVVKRFGAGIESTLNDAATQQLLVLTKNGARPKVMLPGGTQFIYS